MLSLLERARMTLKKGHVPKDYHCDQKDASGCPSMDKAPVLLAAVPTDGTNMFKQPPTNGAWGGAFGGIDTQARNPHRRWITSWPANHDPNASSPPPSDYTSASSSPPPSESSSSSSESPPSDSPMRSADFSSGFQGNYAHLTSGFNASDVPTRPAGTDLPPHKFLDPDDLYAGFYGRPLETFVAASPKEVYKSAGRSTHYDILHRMRELHTDYTPVPKDRLRALAETDWVLGRTGMVDGHRVTSFWNNSYDDDAVKAYVLQQIKEGKLHPHHDLISFRGTPGLQRAGDFVNYTATPEEKEQRQWTPEELAQAHINPELKWQILGAGWRATGMKKRHPWQEALQKAGLLAPGHDWRNPLEASRKGEKVYLSQLDRARQVLQLAQPRPLPSWVPTETPGKEGTTGWVPVSSSWIAGLKFTPASGVSMTVKKGGKDYSYPGLNLGVFRKWLASKSPGKAWWRYVGYPMQDHNSTAKTPRKTRTPIQNSRFVGGVHPLLTPHADGPIAWAPFNKYKLHEVMMWMQRHVHPGITQGHLAALTGWVPGTHLFATHEGPMNPPGGTLDEPSSLSFSTVSPFNSSRTITGRDYSANRTIHSKFKGDFPTVENEHIIIGRNPGNRFRGLSAGNLLRQMRAAHEMGIPRIHWHAALGGESITGTPGGFTGGLHWPFIGADGYVPPYTVREIPGHIREEVHRLSEGRFGAPLSPGGEPQFKFSDMMMSPAAREWYKSNPVGHQAFVDTSPGSYSRKAVERHVSESSAEYGHQAPISDELMPKDPLPTGKPRVQSNAGVGPAGWKPPQIPLPFAMTQPRRNMYHPAIEHLLATGHVHPEHLDDFFCC